MMEARLTERKRRYLAKLILSFSTSYSRKWTVGKNQLEAQIQKALQDQAALQEQDLKNKAKEAADKKDQEDLARLRLKEEQYQKMEEENKELKMKKRPASPARVEEGAARFTHTQDVYLPRAQDAASLMTPIMMRLLTDQYGAEREPPPRYPAGRTPQYERLRDAPHRDYPPREAYPHVEEPPERQYGRDYPRDYGARDRHPEYHRDPPPREQQPYRDPPPRDHAPYRTPLGYGPMHDDPSVYALVPRRPSSEHQYYGRREDRAPPDRSPDRRGSRSPDRRR